MDIKEEILDVVEVMSNDINFKPSDRLKNYIVELIAKSMLDDFDGLNIKENISIEALYTIAEFNLIRATIITIEFPALHAKMAHAAYSRLFDLYVDELAYEILLEINNIVILLFGLKHFSIRDNLLKLIEAKGKSGYVNILLYKNGYVDNKIEE